MKNTTALVTTLSAREATWDSIGAGINTSRFDEALAECGLDFTATMTPAMAAMPDGIVRNIPNTNAVVGTDNKIHGVVSDAYHIIQNREAFDFAQYITEDLTFLRGGETDTGLNYLIAALPSIKVLGDEITPHLIFQNSFNKKYICKAAIYPLRIVCQNQFNVAFRSAENAVTIRHSATAAEKLEQAKITMSTASSYMVEFSKLAEKFATLRVGPDAVDAFADYLFPIKADLKENEIHRLEVKRADLRNCFNADDNGNFRNSAWGLINAYADFATHYSGTNQKVNTFPRIPESLFIGNPYPVPVDCGISSHLQPHDLDARNL